MSENKIIEIEQLPIINEQLHQIKAEIMEKVQTALALVCTEETVKYVKKIRAELNNDFKFWEDKRKAVKTAVMSPYEQFEAVYRECITEVFRTADKELKEKIDNVENKLKEQKKADVKLFFDEYLTSKNIDFVTFENSNITITLSVSMKSLTEQSKAFIDKICDDLNLIDTQEHKDEILFYYKKVDGMCFLNVSKSIQLVTEKYKAIEAEKAKEAERQAAKQLSEKCVEKVEDVVPIAPPVEVEKILTVQFTVKGTKTQLKALKEFLNNGGYEYD